MLRFRNQNVGLNTSPNVVVPGLCELRRAIIMDQTVQSDWAARTHRGILLHRPQCTRTSTDRQAVSHPADWHSQSKLGSGSVTVGERSPITTDKRGWSVCLGYLLHGAVADQLRTRVRLLSARHGIPPSNIAHRATGNTGNLNRPVIELAIRVSCPCVEQHRCDFAPVRRIEYQSGRRRARSE